MDDLINPGSQLDVTSYLTMHTFFHGWRRKAGVFTLVMACLFMGLWMRSFATGDQISFSPFSIISIRGRIAAIRSVQTISPNAPLITTHNAPQVSNFQPDAYGNCPVWWSTQEVGERWDFAGYHFARSKKPEGCLEVGFPQLSLVLPLTLLSAYLILWKPRQPPKPADPEMSSSQRHKDTERTENISTTTTTNSSDLPSVSP